MSCRQPLVAQPGSESVTNNYLSHCHFNGAEHGPCDHDKLQCGLSHTLSDSVTPCLAYPSRLRHATEKPCRYLVILVLTFTVNEDNKLAIDCALYGGWL
jgi:hypothetical protein